MTAIVPMPTPRSALASAIHIGTVIADEDNQREFLARELLQANRFCRRYLGGQNPLPSSRSRGCCSISSGMLRDWTRCHNCWRRNILEDETMMAWRDQVARVTSSGQKAA